MVAVHLGPQLSKHDVQASAEGSVGRERRKALTIGGVGGCKVGGAGTDYLEWIAAGRVKGRVALGVAKAGEPSKRPESDRTRIYSPPKCNRGFIKSPQNDTAKLCFVRKERKRRRQSLGETGVDGDNHSSCKRAPRFKGVESPLHRNKGGTSCGGDCDFMLDFEVVWAGKVVGKDPGTGVPEAAKVPCGDDRDEVLCSRAAK